MFERIVSNVFKIISILCCSMLCAQVLLVFVTVVCRNVFNFVPIWGESLTLLFLVWTSMIGASLPIRNNSHIRVTLIDKHLSEKTLAISDIVVDLVCFAYCCVVCYAGLKMSETVANTVLNGIGISRVYLYLSIPVAMILMLLAFVEKHVTKYKKHKEAGV